MLFVPDMQMTFEFKLYWGDYITCLLMIDVWVVLWWLKDFLLIRSTMWSIFANQIFCVKHMVFLRGFPYRYVEELSIFASLMFSLFIFLLLFFVCVFCLLFLFRIEDILCSNFPVILFSILRKFLLLYKQLFWRNCWIEMKAENQNNGLVIKILWSLILSQWVMVGYDTASPYSCIYVLSNEIALRCVTVYLDVITGTLYIYLSVCSS